MAYTIKEIGELSKIQKFDPEIIEKLYNNVFDDLKKGVSVPQAVTFLTITAGYAKDFESVFEKINVPESRDDTAAMYTKLSCGIPVLVLAAMAETDEPGVMEVSQEDIYILMKKISAFIFFSLYNIYKPKNAVQGYYIDLQNAELNIGSGDEVYAVNTMLIAHKIMTDAIICNNVVMVNGSVVSSIFEEELNCKREVNPNSCVF